MKKLLFLAALGAFVAGFCYGFLSNRANAQDLSTLPAVLTAPQAAADAQGAAELADLQQQRADALAAGDLAAISIIDQQISQTQNVLGQSTTANPSTSQLPAVLTAPQATADAQGAAELVDLQQQRADALAAGDLAAISAIDQQIAKTQNVLAPATTVNTPAQNTTAQQIDNPSINPAENSAKGGGNPNFIPGGPGGNGTTWTANTNRATAPIAAISDECYSCDFFNRIEQIKNVWAVDLYWLIAPEILAVLRSLILLYATVSGVMIMIDSGKAFERAKKLAVSLFLLVVVLIVLSNRTEIPLAWQVIRVIESSSLKLGALIVGHTAAVTIPSGDPGLLYQALAQLVERQVFVVFGVASDIMTGAGWFGVSEAIARAVTALIMLLPYLFVIGIFFAFLVEAMFKFVAISVLSPLLMPALIFPWSRAYVTASLRILLGAFLTIVLASAAMGLTVTVVEQEVKTLKEMIVGSESAQVAAQAEKEKACAFGGAESGNEHGDVFETENQRAACEQARSARDNVDTEAFRAFRSQYFMLVIIGFVSVLLHLQSKSLASNISGANDGPGAAASVVAGAKVALGAGFMMGSKTMFGQGGLGGGIRDGLMSSQVGQTLVEKGIVGSAVKTAANSMRSAVTQSPMGMQNLTGDAAGSAMREMAKAAADSVKKGGMRE